jgi:hypothetical protein
MRGRDVAMEDAQDKRTCAGVDRVGHGCVLL